MREHGGNRWRTRALALLAAGTLIVSGCAASVAGHAMRAGLPGFAPDSGAGPAVTQQSAAASSQVEQPPVESSEAESSEAESSEAESSEAESSEVESSEVESSEAESSEVDAPLLHTQNVTFSNSDGYKVDLSVSVHAPVPMSAVSDSQTCTDTQCSNSRTFDLLQECAADPATTGAIEVDVMATNSTANFPITIDYDIDASDGTDSLNVAASYTDDDTCDASGVQYNEPSESGSSVTKTFWIELDDWMTPNNPNGDPDYFSDGASVSFEWDGDPMLDQVDPPDASVPLS